MTKLNKYWSTNKKKKWLDENYDFVSDRNWGGYWQDKNGNTVATIDNYNYDENLNIRQEGLKNGKN